MSGSTTAIPARSLSLPILAAVVVVVVSVIVAGAIVLSGADLAPKRGPASGVAETTPFDPVLLTLTETGSVTTLAAIDSTTADAVASVALGTSSMALFRQSAGEILASDLVVDASDPARASSRLLVLDRSLRIKRAIPLRDRVQYTLYAPAMVLSPDERTLFYVSRVECGVACDDYAVDAVLVDEGRITGSVALPRNCGYPGLTLYQAEVVILCPQLQSIWRAGTGATATQVASAALSPDWPIIGGLLPDGMGYMITQRGRLLVLDGTRVVRDETLVTPPERFSGLQHWNADGRVVLGVTETAGGSEMTALLVLEPESWRQRRISIPGGSTFAAYMGGERMAVVHDAGFSILSLAGSEVARLSRPALLPASVEVWMIGAGD